MKNLILLILVVFNTNQAVFGLEVFVWKQTPQSANIILPKKDGQTKEEAVAEYFEKLHGKKSGEPLLKQAEIKDLVVDGNLLHEKGVVRDLKATSEKPRFVVVTNELRELYAPPYGRRAANVTKRLEGMGAEVLVLPVMHDLTLNAKESKEYRNLLVEQFDAQLVLGGEDIDPYLYGERVTYSRRLNRRRDTSELKFVRQFIEAKKGMNFGICRGHQMCAVANHKKLIQDIQIEDGASEIHINGDHLIDVDEESEVFSMFNKKQLLVNSLHHQAVLIPDGDADYKVIATSLDSKPVVEGLSFKNGLGVTLQFHPELMHDETGDAILKAFVDLAARNKAQTSETSLGFCLTLMRNFI